MSAARRVRLLVEGCLDAAIATWLLRRAGLAAVPEQVGGGWTGVVRSLIRASLEGLGAPLGLVDADESADKRLEEIKALAKSCCPRLSVGAETVVEPSRGPPLLRLEVKEPSGRSGAGFLTLWCRDPWRGCNGGTVEDLLWAMMEEAWGCRPGGACAVCDGERCPRKGWEMRLQKMLPLAVLVGCAGGSIVDASSLERRCCGVDVLGVLEDPEKGARLAATRAAGAYLRLLGEYLVELLA